MRPATLAASVSPVLAGTAIAVHEGGARIGPGIAALVVGVAMQLGVNFANDYSDFVRGADAVRVGPVRAASSGIVKPEHVRLAAFAAFGVAGAAGLILSLIVDVRLLVVGAACLLAGWLYTGGPRPYGYLGLGEVFVFVFFGLVATAGTVYVETGRVSSLALLIACALGFIATAILVLNNLRDIETDVAAGKRTLATRIGRASTRVLLSALVAAAFGLAIVVGAWPALLALLPAAAALRIAWVSVSPPQLVGALKLMAAAELVYALLFALAMLA